MMAVALAGGEESDFVGGPRRVCTGSKRVESISPRNKAARLLALWQAAYCQ
jgi:hypothetical protein